MTGETVKNCGNCRHQLLVAVDTSAENPKLSQSFRWKICNFFPVPPGLPVWMLKAIDDAADDSKDVVRDEDGSDCWAWAAIDPIH